MICYANISTDFAKCPRYYCIVWCSGVINPACVCGVLGPSIPCPDVSGHIRIVAFVWMSGHLDVWIIIRMSGHIHIRTCPDISGWLHLSGCLDILMSGYPDVWTFRTYPFQDLFQHRCLSGVGTLMSGHIRSNTFSNSTNTCSKTSVCQVLERSNT